MTPVSPMPVGSIRRTAQMVLASVVLLLTVGLALAATVRSAIALFGRAGFGPIDLATPALLAIALILVRHVTRWPSSIRSLPLVPRSIQGWLRLTAERSIFGVGSVRSWTTTDPGLGQDRLLLPTDAAATDAAATELRESAAPAPLAARPVAQVAEVAEVAEASVVGHRPTAASHVRDGGTGAHTTAQTAAQTGVHTIGRADTWWSLAERLLGDGKQWATLVELNQGREVAPGEFVNDSRPLRRGWKIIVPLTPELKRASKQESKADAS